MKTGKELLSCVCLVGAAWKPKAGSPSTVHLSVSKFLGGKYFFWGTGQQHGNEVKILDLHNVDWDGSAVPVSPGAARPAVYCSEWDTRGWVTFPLMFWVIKESLRVALVFALEGSTCDLDSFHFCRRGQIQIWRQTRPADPLGVIHTSEVNVQLWEPANATFSAVAEAARVSAVSVICTHSYLILIRRPVPSRFCAGWKQNGREKCWNFCKTICLDRVSQHVCKL